MKSNQIDECCCVELPVTWHARTASKWLDFLSQRLQLFSLRLQLHCVKLKDIHCHQLNCNKMQVIKLEDVRFHSLEVKYIDDRLHSLCFFACMYMCGFVQLDRPPL